MFSDQTIWNGFELFIFVWQNSIAQYNQYSMILGGGNTPAEIGPYKISPILLSGNKIHCKTCNTQIHYTLYQTQFSAFATELETFTPVCMHIHCLCSQNNSIMKTVTTINADPLLTRFHWLKHYTYNCTINYCTPPKNTLILLQNVCEKCRTLFAIFPNRLKRW